MLELGCETSVGVKSPLDFPSKLMVKGLDPDIHRLQHGPNTVYGESESRLYKVHPYIAKKVFLQGEVGGK